MLFVAGRAKHCTVTPSRKQSKELFLGAPKHYTASVPYLPTDQEHERAAHLRSSLSLPASRAAEYHALVAQALLLRESGGLWQLTIEGHQGRIARLYEYPSHLFGERYLVAACERAWFRSLFPETDAVCLPMSQGTFWEFPPLIVVPASFGRRLSERFTSVVEHEIVHIHQVLLGTFPKPPKTWSASSLLAFLFAHTQAEYEANFIQLTRWPALYPIRTGLSLDHWCILRGYSQGLENVLRHAAYADVAAVHVETFLDRLEHNLPRRMGAAGLDSAFASRLRNSLPQHVESALELAVLRPLPAFTGRASVRAAAAWARARLMRD
jgi:hypothetical protein